MYGQNTDQAAVLSVKHEIIVVIKRKIVAPVRITNNNNAKTNT